MSDLGAQWQARSKEMGRRLAESDDPGPVLRLLSTLALTLPGASAGMARRLGEIVRQEWRAGDTEALDMGRRALKESFLAEVNKGLGLAVMMQAAVPMLYGAAVFHGCGARVAILRQRAEGVGAGASGSSTECSR